MAKNGVFCPKKHLCPYDISNCLILFEYSNNFDQIIRYSNNFKGQTIGTPYVYLYLWAKEEPELSSNDRGPVSLPVALVFGLEEEVQLVGVVWADVAVDTARDVA